MVDEFRRIVIGATSKSSGKTSFSIGLIAALVKRGMRVHPFKKGPDYIDPRWLSAAAGHTCHNLDFFMMGRDKVMSNFLRHAAGADLSLIETNMGLFDGQDVYGGDCGAALAELLRAPILLVVNCRGVVRGVAALVTGYVGFPGGAGIQGIVLNQVATSRQEGRILAALQHYCSVPVLGVLPRNPHMVIDERHLGLEPACERDGVTQQVEKMGAFVSEHMELDPILRLTHPLPALPVPPVPSIFPPVNAVPTASQRRRVAYVTDRVFHFYYPENLTALRDCGVELVPVSLLADEQLPDVSGLYIGGGFPEMFMDFLEANARMMVDIRHKVQAGLPVYAECGGLMVLSETIRWQGNTANMIGALPIDVAMGDRPQGYGYMEVEGRKPGYWPQVGQRVPCHEFHYSRVVRIGEGVDFAYRVIRGYGVDGRHDGILHRNILASYAHIHVDGAPGWAAFLSRFWRT